MLREKTRINIYRHRKKNKGNHMTVVLLFHFNADRKGGVRVYVCLSVFCAYVYVCKGAVRV